MAVSRSKVWVSYEVLTATDLNGEFNNVLNNGESLGWPATQAKDLNGNEVTLDVDGDTGIVSDTDDRIDFKISGLDLFRFDGTATTPVNGLDFIAKETTVAPIVQAVGSDTDIDIDIIPKGAGILLLNTLNAAADVNFVLGSRIFGVV